jgi:hypothetical protein
MNNVAQVASNLTCPNCYCQRRSVRYRCREDGLYEFWCVECQRNSPSTRTLVEAQTLFMTVKSPRLLARERMVSELEATVLPAARGTLAKDVDLVPGSFWTVVGTFDTSSLQVGDLIEVRYRGDDAVTFRQHRAESNAISTYNSQPADNEIVQDILNQRSQVVPVTEQRSRERSVRWTKVRERLTVEMNATLDALNYMEQEELDAWLDDFWLARKINKSVPGLLPGEVNLMIRGVRERREESGYEPPPRKSRDSAVSTPPVKPVPAKIRILEPLFIVDPEPEES